MQGLFDRCRGFDNNGGLTVYWKVVLQIHKIAINQITKSQVTNGEFGIFRSLPGQGP